MRVPVLWWEGARGYWDHGLLMHAFTGRLYPLPRVFEFDQAMDAVAVGDRGCVVVVPGAQFCAAGDVDELRAFVDARPWALVLLVSDEEGRFPYERLQTPTSLVVVQTPRPDIEPAAVMPLGWRHDTRAAIRAAGLDALPPERRPLLYSFAGQVTHSARRACVRALEAYSARPDARAGALEGTEGFAQGMDYPDYLRLLRDSAVAPSPSGPHTPDCFRTYEALELGCLPIVEPHSPSKVYGEGGYWQHAFPGCGPPFPQVGDWSQAVSVLQELAASESLIKRSANAASSWWQQYKRTFVELLTHWTYLASGAHPAASDAASLRDKVTVVVPTSPSPEHPSVDMVLRAIANVRAYPELADCEIILTIDGVNPEQAEAQPERVPAYAEYTRRLLWLCNWSRELEGVVPVVFDEHAHQSGMMRRAVEMVRTPYVLYVEHDTWPCGDIDWRGLVRALDSDGEVNLIRLHHMAQVHPEHRYMMGDDEPQDVAGVPLLRTCQWSQRPHLARLSFYQRVMADFFPPDARTMIEDRMHGPVADDVLHRGVPFERWGLWMYAGTNADGSILHSRTSDGRGSDPKYSMDFGGGR